MKSEKPSLLMLKTIPFFQKESDDELERMAQSMWIENRRRGFLLEPMPAEEPAQVHDTTFFVYQGVVAVYTITSRGRRKILFFQGAGKLVDQNIAGHAPDTVRAAAAADAILICVHRKDLLCWIQNSQTLLDALLTHYEKKLWRLSHQLKNSADSRLVERKFAAKLLKLSQDFGIKKKNGTEVGFNLTITQMADYIGAPRETVSRVCGKLAEQGIILYQNKRFVIPDRDQLRSFRDKL